MFASLTYSLRLAIRRTMMGFAAAIFMLIGIGFLTVAAWIAMASAYGAATAALIIGFVYFGVGMILLAIASVRRPIAAPLAAPAAAPMASSVGGLTGAFIQGIGAGIAARANAPAAPPPPPQAYPAE